MQTIHTIGFHLQRVANMLLRESDQVLQEQLGIGMAQLKILEIVQKSSRLLQRQIAEALNQTEASISRQVKLLHNKQLLITRPNPKDHRERITTLTPRGMRLVEAALELLQSFQTPLISDLSEKQQAELMNMLSKIEQRITPPEDPSLEHKHNS